ncbi:tRNA pseudouridine(38-40) synthase TruA [Aureimonas sp. AU4]|uniref:tRNA pseudouridine(38-40) synthase TruA n=1 Tax=Aureimonas sp. AU4 TaxID=1638163 RepID=UPI000705DE36|nr:tRNA pseudouridine(38-40) synthase TruA [Aureimonas sp. AU4]BAT30367.1 tRNA pseudouridine synthase A [Aureimonas sp. AU4]
MPRYKLTIEYDGTPYVGWQRQKNGLSVQEVLERTIGAFAREEVTVFGAGRTDAGVHALGQVAHVDLAREWRADTVRDALNASLREAGGVSVLAAERVPDAFDARFSARKRHYLYRILDRRPPPTVLKGHVWWVWRPLDVPAMHEAAQRLLGTHDFNAFRSVNCQAKSSVRTLERLDVTREGAEIHIRASAQSFLHNQIRSFAGTLKLVGEGRWSGDDVEAVLASADRTRCGPVAPPDGLYLTQVDYEA